MGVVMLKEYFVLCKKIMGLFFLFLLLFLDISAMHRTSRSPGAYFDDIVGVSEDTFIRWDSRRRAACFSQGLYEGRSVWAFKKQNTEEFFQCGAFEKLAYKNILRQYQARRATGAFSRGGGIFNVIQGDIWELQSNSAHRGAVFQVASNFNALELLDHTDWPNKLSNYHNDHTQGPSASVSAMPGLILRRYFIFPDEPHEQTAERQINLLGSWDHEGQHGVPQNNNKGMFEHNRVNSKYATLGFVCNGYYILPVPTWASGWISDGLLPLKEVESSGVFRASEGKSPVDLSDMVDHVKDLLVNEREAGNIFIGYHRDVQVTHRSYNERVSDPAQIIDQVFFAAINLGSGSGGANYWASGFGNVTQDLSKFFLMIAYKSILMSALLHGKNKVFLTLMGCGVFGNKLGWVVDCLSQCKNLIKESGLEVNLVVYQKNEIEKSSLVHEQEELKALVADTGGLYFGKSVGASIGHGYAVTQVIATPFGAGSGGLSSQLLVLQKCLKEASKRAKKLCHTLVLLGLHESD
jgi:hypothetical protein